MACSAPELILIKHRNVHRTHLAGVRDQSRRTIVATHRQIPGTPIFGGDEARKGFALNKMCFSFNDAGNRAAFLKDEEAYCAKYGLSPKQREAVKRRNVLEMIEAGGNVYYLAKLAGIFGLNVQDLGAQQTGMTVDAFKEKLRAAGR